MKTREKERRDWGILIILILLLGFFCIILASGWAIRFAPSWRLDTNMRSNLNPNSDFLTSRPVSFIEPLDPAILTNPAWLNVFLTPGASLPTRTPKPAIPPTNAPPKTATPTPTTLVVPATNTLVFFPSPTNTKVSIPPSATATPLPSSTPIPQADLRITKTDGVATYNPGGTLTYTITVTNNGPSTVNGARVTDNISAQILNWTWVCTAQNGGASGCNGMVGSAANFTDDVNLPNGASIVYTVTANISMAAAGNLTNTAIVSVPPALYSDPVPGNNSATDTDTLIYISDLSITKTDGVAVYIPGNTLTYTVTVINNGPNQVTGAIITDNIPVQITSWDWACTSQTGGATGCDPVAASTVNFTDTVNLPSGASIVYTVTANTSIAATGNLVNTTTVGVPFGNSDPVPVNNIATDTDTQFIPTSVDLQITKTDGVATYTAGLPLTYTVTVTNNGPNPVIGATVTDTIPAQVTSWSWTCVQNGGATGCDAVAGSTVNFTDTVDLPSTASIVYTVTANISSAATGNLTNTASVSVPPVTYTDPAPGNNSASDTDTLAPVSDLQITKTDNATDYAAGIAVQYTIVVSNPTGPSAANGATVSDTFSANLTGITWACVGVGGASCTANGAGNINDAAVNLPVGASVTYTVNATVIAAPVGTLDNTATVTLATDPVPGNNTAADSDVLIVSSPIPTGNIGSVKDTVIEVIPSGGITTLQLAAPLVVGSHAGYDLVYYELSQGTNPGVFMDRVQLQIGDGRNWYTILNWGDGIADTNTNISIPLGAPNPTNCAGEPDNCEIDASFLMNLTGIAMELDGVVPNGTYLYIRIISPNVPADSGDGVEVDAITILP